ncbi:MAG: RNA-binding protein [Chitinispirillales bacterium]|jgi:RNA recognition motif-containing protein|nr:RNA-binding protein [Chitinispirillales bacterium]
MPQQQKLYIGNLPYRTTAHDLRALFEKYGPILSVILVADKGTNRPRGYGFVELEASKAKCAVCEMGNAYFNGRYIRVSNAEGRKTNGNNP